MSSEKPTKKRSKVSPSKSPNPIFDHFSLTGESYTNAKGKEYPYIKTAHCVHCLKAIANNERSGPPEVHIRKEETCRRHLRYCRCARRELGEDAWERLITEETIKAAPTSKPVVTIGIAGGTGAGKTTLARRLFENLGGEANVNYLVHDYYYKDISDKTVEERAQTNFDHPESLDTELLLQHVQDLKHGRRVQVPTYDFCTHSRTNETVTMDPHQIILVEGILIFCHPELVQELDIKVYVDADADIRLMRRIQRDCQERGRTVEDVLEQYHSTVRPMHHAWVEPSKKEADMIVHSTHHSLDVTIEMLTNHLLTVTDLK